MIVRRNFEGKLKACSLPFSLDLCLDSGQSFAWKKHGDLWMGSIRRTGFMLQDTKEGIRYISSSPSPSDSKTLMHYLALDEDHRAILQSFPSDPFLKKSMRYCKGLRVLRQDPWECLAGFILSSTKKIVHIRQIWQKLCCRWGHPVSFPSSSRKDGFSPLHSFPEASVIAGQTEMDLRACGMGFRAPYLLAAAREVAEQKLDLEKLKGISTAEARDRLMQLKGVGRKIADCVLLFSLDKPDAFPIDTWILKVLHKVYFYGKRRRNMKGYLKFVEGYFGSHAGHAQQYLFHYARMNPETVVDRLNKRDSLTMKR